MVWPIAAAMVAQPLISSLLQKKVKPQTVNQGPMYTPEQQEAVTAMMNFAKSGRHGTYQAGEGYEGKLGHYDMTDMEKGGQSKLTDLMNQAIGTQNFSDGMGNEELTKLLRGDKFDPYSDKGTYAGFKKQTLRDLSESQDRLKQNMAMTGDLYSTATAKESGLLEERGQDQLTSELGRLYQHYSDQKVGAIPWAMQGDQFADEMGFREKGQNENIAMGRIDASQKYGATQRLIEDMKAKDMYGEWKRSREEEKEPLKALESVYGKSTDWGSKSMTAPGYTAESPWSKVLNTGIELLSKYATSNWNMGGGTDESGFMSYTGSGDYGSKLNLNTPTNKFNYKKNYGF